ncbi:MAG: hypothetical protein IJJ59_07005 [Pseudobutyrivibrio sp.]|uniref:WcbI family polysaccharide biosynthesis putative acetyltransferase n=1 Tax=Pseudobutyrivibrio sp. TaxID=2014367 RepID=UPI0025E91A9F|nr:WcbI family polysaccharide biosynthesis putative acetyltransferase [Pseudobutyrivibrio sp.]MBQ6463054.1 hypothetical protein [Pseudobutyrivibrio sp.]
MIKTKSNVILIHGTGMIGEKFYTRFYKKFYIAGFIDVRKRKEFHGIKVFRPDEIEIGKLKKTTIIVATNAKVYKDIKDFYEKKGLEEFEDFIFWNELGRELAIIYGNCHTHVLKHYLEMTPEFIKKYAIRSFSVFGYDVTNKSTDYNLVNHCDLLITQDIRKDNSTGVISAEELIYKIPNRATSLIIPNLYGINLFYPQLYKGEDYGKIHIDNIGIEDPRRLYELRWESGFLNCRDKYIRLGLEGKISKQDILNIMNSENSISPEEIESNFNSGIHKIECREKDWDIKICDYIINNYKCKQLFYDPYHPTEVLICEIGRRLLEKINISSTNIILEPILNDTELFIYESVKKVLGLEYSQEYIRVGKLHACLVSMGGLTREEYIDDVLDWSGECV